MKNNLTPPDLTRWNNQKKPKAKKEKEKRKGIYFDLLCQKKGILT